MKTFLSILTGGIILFLGCVDENLINAPEKYQSSGLNWITLPQRNGPSVDNTFSVSQTISGAVGGELIINQQYSAGIHGNVSVFVKLKFLPNSFSGTQNITMVVDDYNGTVDYSPSLVLNEPAELYVTFEGVDLFGINPLSINYIFLDPSSGNSGIIDYEDLLVDVPTGKLDLVKGNIFGDSVYGFSR